jgi:RNA polymerase sigma factor (sigma-70 family)
MDRIEGFHDLIARARAGDRAAIDALLQRMRPWIEQVARDQSAPHCPDHSVSDLVQEAWLRAWQKLDQFQGTADEAQSLAMFRAWLERIVSRLGLNVARDADAQHRKPPGKLLRLNSATEDSPPGLDPPAPVPTPSANASADEHLRLLQEALAGLSDPLDRDIIRLRFFDGLSLRQIALQVGGNHETIRERYHAVLARLQQRLKGLE